jgi:hypothetical protein
MKVHCLPTPMSKQSRLIYFLKILNSKTDTDANDQGVVVNINQARERYACDGGVLQMLQQRAGSVASHIYFSFSLSCLR